jgi:hypothetical protein
MLEHMACPLIHDHDRDVVKDQSELPNRVARRARVAERGKLKRPHVNGVTPSSPW